MLRTDAISFKLKGAFLFGCEVFISDYDCNSPPNRRPIFKSTGMESFGFILGHAYNIERVEIKKANREPCKIDGCNNAKKYNIEIEYFLSEKIFLGLSFGAQEGSSVWKSRSRKHKAVLNTPCICCDAEPDSSLSRKHSSRYLRPADEPQSSAVWAVALVLAAMGLAFVDFPAAHAVSAFIAVAALISTMLAVIRSVIFRRSASDGAQNHHADDDMEHGSI